MYRSTPKDSHRNGLKPVESDEFKSFLLRKKNELYETSAWLKLWSNILLSNATWRYPVLSTIQNFSDLIILEAIFII